MYYESFSLELKALINGVILKISNPIVDWSNYKPQTLKADFSISYFSIPKMAQIGQMGINLVYDCPISKI